MSLGEGVSQDFQDNREYEEDRESIETPKPTRILIVDDHPMIREGLRGCLLNRSGLEICGEAEGVDDALRAIKIEKPDLAIVDLALRDTCGLELVKLLRKLSRNTKIIVHSMYDSLLYAERSLQAGAHGYVNKQADPAELLKAIDRVLDGELYMSQDTSQRLLRRKVHSNGELLPEVDVLSDRELEVFRLIGLGMPTSKISDGLHVSRHTVDSHRENIKTKLGLKSGTELSRRAFQWVLENG